MAASALAASVKGLRAATARLSPGAWIGIAIIAAHVAVALAGPWLAPHRPGAILTTRSFAPSGELAPFGADYLGRDLFSRMLHGARYTLGLAFAATVLGFAIGLPAGFAAAELRGTVDTIVGRTVDVVMSFPPLLLALVVIAGTGPSLTAVIGVVAVIHATRVTRIARSVALGIAVQDFVEVARARGESLASILFREILPNAVRPLVTEFGLRLTFSILFLSSLSFLGLGVQPPEADWGLMVRENIGGLLSGSLAPLLPAAAIASLTVGITLVIDAGLAGRRETTAELLR